MLESLHTAHRIFVQSCFCMDNSISIELPNLVQLPHVDDAISIRSLHWELCDTLLLCPKCCCLWYPVFSTFRMPSPWSSRDYCAFAPLTMGVLRKMIWINSLLHQICSWVSLKCVEEVFWESFHHHCWQIQILLLPILAKMVGVSQEESCSRSPDAASASLRGLGSTITPGTTIGSKFRTWNLTILQCVVNVVIVSLTFMGIPMFFA